MADLHEALKSLAPTDWSDVPLDDLSEYLSACFAAGELICNSVPDHPNGTPFHSSKPHHRHPNSAKTAKEMHPSVARSHPPHQDHVDLQSSWGRPMKFNKKDNPHEVALYKMAGHDRHGAWFARRSVHEGMGFKNFKAAMQKEFPHSLTIDGGPGAGAVRGLGGDQRLERENVGGIGTLEVYQLSAKMPPPVTPRDFVALVLTTDDALTDKSAPDLEDGKKGSVPRHYMILSKPVEHADAPERSEFVRGQYESVELIREVPLHEAKAKSTPNLLATQGEHQIKGRERGISIGFAESRGPDAKGEQRDLDARPGVVDEDDAPHDPELNPVEWIMITRSDPGGGIPRFLVDRGTPDAMLGDLNKFLDWATAMQEATDPGQELENQQMTSEHTVETQEKPPSHVLPNGEVDKAEAELDPLQKSVSDPLTGQEQGTGVFSHIQNTLEAGFDAYAPTAVSQQVHDYLHPVNRKADLDESDSDSDSDSSSVGSFMSAEEIRRISNAHELSRATTAADTISIAPSESSSMLELKQRATNKEKLSEAEKEILKLGKQREKLDQKLAKKRQEEESKLKKSQEKEQSEQDKAKEKLEKERKKTEERHRKEIEKLEQKKASTARKVEEKRRKKDEQNKISLVSRERDELRSQLDSYKRETGLLIRQVEDLQRENTALTKQLVKFGGEDAVARAVQVGAKADGKTSAASVRSGDSQKSVDI